MRRAQRRVLPANAPLQIARGLRAAAGRQGALYSKGCGVFGALGHGENLADKDVFHRLALPTFVPGVVKVSAGWGHSAAITSEAKLLVFGRPYDFSNILQINRLRMVSPGLGRFVGRFTNWFGDANSDQGLWTVPRIMEGVDDVASVSCSAGLTTVLTHSGNVLSFGLNRWGQCGVAKHASKIHVYEPTRVVLPSKASMVDAGLQHCIVLLENGAVYTWGKGNRGQLGDGSNDTSSTPVHIKKHLLPHPAVAVSAGFNHTAALTNDGAFYVWGKGMSTTPRGMEPNSNGDSSADGANKLRSSKNSLVQVYEDQPVPRRVELPEGRKAVEICSSNFTLVIRADDGSLWAMGLGEYDRNTILTPIRVQQAIDPELELESVAMGGGGGGGEKSEQAPPHVHLSSTVVMRKGYQRVVLFDTASPLTSTASSSSSSSSASCQGLRNYATSDRVFEVVVHQGECFLQAVPFSKEEQSKQLVDYSQGWQHSLAIFDDVP